MKCIIIGDSISEGIGSKKMNYENMLLQYCPQLSKIHNLAKTGTTIDYAQNIIQKIIDNQPDIVIIMYGSVDAQIRPNLKRNRFGICDLIPKRYKIGGMLDPRAFYSKKWYRIPLDRLDNGIRFILKKIVLMTQGKIQLVNSLNFEKEYEHIVSLLTEKNIKIVAVSTMYIDDSYFLGSSFEYCKYNSIIENIAKEYGCAYVDLYNLTKIMTVQHGWDKLYSHDHFHPNALGYELIAKTIAKYIDV